MIKPRIPFYLLGLRGLLTISHRVLELLEARHPEEVFLQGSVDKLKTAEEFASKAVGSTQKAFTTKHVTTADDDRDNSYESLKAFIKAGLKRNNTDFREKCERLYAILEKNDTGLARLPYAQQTVALHGLFRDLDTVAAQADLTGINALAWYTELKTNQTEFEAAVQERGEERSANDAPTSREAFDALKPAVKFLFKVLDVAEEGEMFADVGETVTRVNVLVTEVINAHRRGTGIESEEDEEEL